MAPALEHHRHSCSKVQRTSPGPPWIRPSRAREDDGALSTPLVSGRLSRTGNTSLLRPWQVSLFIVGMVPTSPSGCGWSDLGVYFTASESAISVGLSPPLSGPLTRLSQCDTSSGLYTSHPALHLSPTRTLLGFSRILDPQLGPSPAMYHGTTLATAQGPRNFARSCRGCDSPFSPRLLVFRKNDFLPR